MKEQTFRGEWWLPEQCDRSVFGVASVTEGGTITLDLAGTLGDTGMHGPLDTRTDLRRTLVLGRTDRGGLVTLYQCFQSELSSTWNQSSEPAHVTTFRAHYLIVGAHVTTIEDLRFSQMEAEIDLLAEWAAYSGLSGDIRRLESEGNESTTPSYEYTTSYRFPEQVTATIAGAVMSMTHAISFTGDRLNEMGLRQDTSWTITTSEPQTLEHFIQNEFAPFQELLTLATGEPVQIRTLRGYLSHAARGVLRITQDLPSETSPGGSNSTDGEEPGTQEEEPPAASTRRRVDVYFRAGDRPRPTKSMHPVEMFFSLADLADSLSAHLQKWYAAREVLKPVYNLYFSTRYGQRQYLQTEFLSLTQALETYHRRRMDRTIISAAAGRALAAHMKACARDSFANCPEGVELSSWNEARQSMLTALGFFNHIGLKQRLLDILRSCEPLTGMIVASPDEFTRAVKNTRNYLTHYDERASGGETPLEDLFGATVRLGAILEVCLLDELGLSAPTRSRLIEQRQRYLRLNEWNLV